jgi:hypothetical protein
VDNCRFRKRQQLPADSGEQKVAISSRQIPTADPPCEQDIPSIEPAARRIVEAEAAGAMSRDLVEIEFAAQKVHPSPFGKFLGGGHRFHFQIHAEAPEKPPVGKHLLSDRVHGHGASMEPCQGCRIPDMVKVAMGKYQKGDGSIPESFG